MRHKAYFVLISILFIIIFSINTVSATLSVTGIESSAGISYRMANDTVIINVSSSTNVSVNGIPCVLLTEKDYICSVTNTVNVPKVMYQLINADNETAIASINVDNNIGGVNYTVTNTQNSALLEYAIVDLGFDNTPLCSGIKSLSVYDATTILNTVDLGGVPGTCNYFGAINLSVGDSGTKSIYLEVTDNVGNVKRTSSQNITLDLSAPVIVNGLVVKYSGTDEELDVIGGDASIFVDLYFSIREDNLENILLDLSEVNTNPTMQYAYRNLKLPLDNCIENVTAGEVVHNCVVAGVPLKLADSTLGITVTAKDVFNNTASGKLTKSLTIDNLKPVVSITTDTCDSIGRCYIKNGLNKIIITTNKENFNKKYLFFTIPGSTFTVNRVQNCSGTTCFAMVSLTCDTGSSVDVSITSSSGFESQDDAGNIVSPYTTNLYCDNNAPAIKNLTVTGDSSAVIKDLLVSGSTITIKARVMDVESYELTATAFLDKLKNTTEKGTCTRIANYDFECVWIISSINAGYYSANVLVNISDIMNNTVDKSITFDVYGFKSDNETPDFLDISARDVYPKEINRIVLDMATNNGIPYYVYATYDLSVKNVVDTKKISVLHQQVDISKCVYIGSLGEVSASSVLSASSVFSEIKVSNPYSRVDELGRIDLRFLDNTDPNMLVDDEFIISCNVSAIVKKDKEIYKKTEDLPLDMTFKLVNTKLCNVGQECTPGEMLGVKIQKAEDNFLVRSELMGTINMIIPKVQKLCSLRDYISQGTTGAQVLSIAMNAVSVGTGEVKFGNIPVQLYLQLFNLDACFSGPRSGSRSSYNQRTFGGYTGSRYNRGLSGSAINLNQNNNPNDMSDILGTANYVADTANPDARSNMAGACNKIVADACEFLSCSATKDAAEATSTALPDLFGGEKSGTSFIGESTDMLLENIDVPDVKNSAVMAAATQCWPALYYNVNKWRQTECNYVYCLKMASYTGTDVSACDYAKKAQTCSLIVGEIFELPGANMIKNVMENAADYVKNFFPLAAASLLKKAACPAYNQDKVFVNAKVDLPPTVPQQTWQIYGCQLPLQIARFADMNARSSQRGEFVYPETPDMCQYAKCVGEPNCKYEPGFWEVINKMNLPTNKKNKIDVDKGKAIAESNANIRALGELRKTEVQISATEKVIKDMSNAPGRTFGDTATLEKHLQELESKRTKQLEYLQGEKGLVSNYKLTNADKLAMITTNSKEYMSASNHEMYNAIATNRVKLLEEYPDIKETVITFPDGTKSKQYSIVQSQESKGAIDYEGALKAQEKLNNLQRQEDIILEQSVAQYNSKVIYNDAIKIRDCIGKMSKTADGALNCNDIKGADAKFLPESVMANLSMNINGDEKSPYGLLSMDQKRDVNNQQAGYYDRLIKYDEALKSGYESPYGTVYIEGEGEISTDALKSNYIEIANALNLCTSQGGTIPCDSPEKLEAAYVTDDGAGTYSKQFIEKFEATQKNIVDLDKTIKRYNSAEKMGNGVFMALQYLHANNMVRFMFTDWYTEKLFGEDLSDYLDFDKYKESLCNPSSPLHIIGSDADPGTVISCSSGFCQPVLTYATERIELEYPNGTKYNIYTSVYYLSAGDLRGRNITYNVYFKGSGKPLYGYKYEQQMMPFDIIQKKVVFKTSKEYTEMCIEFNNKFPPENSLDAKDSYCRPIIEKVFDTGSPWTPEEEVNDGEYLDEYDDEGNRIRASGRNTVDNRPPGVFE